MRISVITFLYILIFNSCQHIEKESKLYDEKTKVIIYEDNPFIKKEEDKSFHYIKNLYLDSVLQQFYNKSKILEEPLKVDPNDIINSKIEALTIEDIKYIHEQLKNHKSLNYKEIFNDSILISKGYFDSIFKNKDDLKASWVKFKKENDNKGLFKISKPLFSKDYKRIYFVGSDSGGTYSGWGFILELSYKNGKLFLSGFYQLWMA